MCDKGREYFSLSLSSLARRVRDFHVEFEERMVEERSREKEGSENEVWKLELDRDTRECVYTCSLVSRSMWKKRGERRGEEKWRKEKKKKRRNGCRATKSFV